MAGKFEFFKGKAGEFRFRLIAGNGEIILANEGYKQRASAENGIEPVKSNAAADGRYERKETDAGNFWFNLRATNGQVIGTSESYKSAAGGDNGIVSVKKNAADAQIVVLIVDDEKEEYRSLGIRRRSLEWSITGPIMRDLR